MKSDRCARSSRNRGLTVASLIMRFIPSTGPLLQGWFGMATLLYCVFYGYVVFGVISAMLVGFSAFRISAIIVVVFGTLTDPSANSHWH